MTSSMKISLDAQLHFQTCDGCKTRFKIFRGSVFDGNAPFAIYLIALHGHSPLGNLAHLAIGLIDRDAQKAPPIAVAMYVRSAPDQLVYTLDDWSNSPWNSESYLGRFVDRAEALALPQKSLLFHVAEHIVCDLPEVRTYLHA